MSLWRAAAGPNGRPSPASLRRIRTQRTNSFVRTQVSLPFERTRKGHPFGTFAWTRGPSPEASQGKNLSAAALREAERGSEKSKDRLCGNAWEPLRILDPKCLAESCCWAFLIRCSTSYCRCHSCVYISLQPFLLSFGFTCLLQA